MPAQDDKQHAADQAGLVFNQQLGRMLEAINGKNDVDLASFLAITQQSVAGARKRSKIPPAWVISISRRLGISADWILYGTGIMQRGLPDWRHRVSEPGDQAAPAALKRDRQSEAGLRVTVLESRADLANSHLGNRPSDDLIFLPLAENHLSDEDGSMVLINPSNPSLAFKREWLNRLGSEIGKLVIFIGKGNSMEPSIIDGDMLIVDLGRVRILDGSIYALGAGSSILTKRLYLLSTGKVRIISDNPHWAAEEADPADLRILGRVIWRAGPVGPFGG